MVTGRPLLTLWAQWATVLHKVQTFIGYSPAFIGIVPKVPGIFLSGTKRNKVSNLGQWEKVALFPSSDFIAKNQLAREGSQSVSPVTIPALTTIVDRQFKEDRTLRGSQSLLFISFKKGHTSDIRPSTLSSWLKQTILLCYKQADQQSLGLGPS